MKNGKLRAVTRLFIVLAGCLLFSSFSPSLDGRAVVVDEGVFPPGLFAKTVGYLPGDSIIVTSIGGESTVEVRVIGALDPSEGVAIMLSPEAAAEIGIAKNSNAIVKITKRPSQDEIANGSAIIASQAFSSNAFEEEKDDSFDDSILNEDIQNTDYDSSIPEPENKNEIVSEPQNEIEENPLPPEEENIVPAEISSDEQKENPPVENIYASESFEDFDSQADENIQVEDMSGLDEEIEIEPEVEETPKIAEVPEVTEISEMEEEYDEPEDEIIEEVPEELISEEENTEEEYEDSDFVEEFDDDEFEDSDLVEEFDDDEEYEDSDFDEEFDDEDEDYYLEDEETEEPVEETVDETVEENLQEETEPSEEISEELPAQESEEPVPELVDENEEIPPVIILSEDPEMVEPDKFVEDTIDNETIAEKPFEEEEYNSDFGKPLELEDDGTELVVEEINPEEEIPASELFEEECEVDTFESVPESMKENVPETEPEEEKEAEVVAEEIVDEAENEKIEEELVSEPELPVEAAKEVPEENTEIVEEENSSLEIPAEENEKEDAAVETENTEETITEEENKEPEIETDEEGNEVISEEYEAIVLVPVEGGNPPEAEEEKKIQEEIAPVVETPAENEVTNEVVVEENSNAEEDVIALDTESTVVEVEEPEVTPAEEIQAEPAPISTAPVVEITKPAVEEKTSELDKYKVDGLKDLKSGNYYIQIAVYRDEANIKTVIEKYGKNYPVTLVPLSSGTAYQVLIGPLNVDEYAAVLNRFKAYGYKDAFLRKIK